MPPITPTLLIVIQPPCISLGEIFYLEFFPPFYLILQKAQLYFSDQRLERLEPLDRARYRRLSQYYNIFCR